MDVNVVGVAVGVVLAVIGGAWILLTLAGRQWERRQEMQFAVLTTHISEIQIRMDRYYGDMARLELKISESEKNALLNFALKRDVEIVQRDILTEVKELGRRIDEWTKTMAGYMDRSTDRSQHRT